MIIQFIFVSLHCLLLNPCSKTEYITTPCESVSILYGLGSEPLSIGVYVFNIMKRTKFTNVKRKGTQGRYSIYYKIWNIYHPEDPIIPKTGYVIHHIDYNPNNNNSENLLKMSDSEHKRHHTTNGNNPSIGMRGKKVSIETRKKSSQSHLGQIPWNKGIAWTEKTKQKISNSSKGRISPCGMLGKKHAEETKQKMRGKIPWNKGLKKEDYEANKDI